MSKTKGLYGKPRIKGYSIFGFWRTGTDENKKKMAESLSKFLHDIPTDEAKLAWLIDAAMYGVYFRYMSEVADLDLLEKTSIEGE